MTVWCLEAWKPFQVLREGHGIKSWELGDKVLFSLSTLNTQEHRFETFSCQEFVASVIHFVDISCGRLKIFYDVYAPLDLYY
jgi:hypothetical protein